MIRLSFIVPFYNSEPFIEQCVRSLYNQNIPKEDYEVICVDDCSPDGSREIVENLQKEYPTLRLLKTPENLRQGGARNIGLKASKGIYVWFVDSDDYIIPNCLGTMLQTAEKENLDLLRIYHVNEGEQRTDMVEYGSCTGSELVFDAPMNEKPDQRCCSVCTGLISRELLTKNNIYFAEKVQYEDDDYAYQFYAKSERVHLIPLSPYIVRGCMESTTRSKHTLRIVNDAFAQTLRIAKLEKELSKIDKRWRSLVEKSIRGTIDSQIFVWLGELDEEDQIKFFKFSLSDMLSLKPYLGGRVLLSLFSYKLWKYWFCNK